ncbi:MAG: guanylate kinase [Faecalimonas sp.]|nr:guanylate kinase [Faecalimonas sp.]
MSKIFYLMGKSASGKDTIYKKIKEKLPELSPIVLYTTRPIRENEREGVEYHFVDEEKLRELQKAGKVIELRAYDTVHGVWKYFTVDDGQFAAEQNYVAIGTLESYKGLRDYLGEDCLIPIYIEVDDGLRLARALERERAQGQPKYEELCRRFLADAADFSEEKLREAGITNRFRNVDIETCVEEIVLGIRENL